jgi:predicted nucleic acid-binding protein
VTPTSDSPSPVLLDTSAAVAFVLDDHRHHDSAVAALVGRDRGLAGHAAFETFSVLTRLPSPARRSLSATASVLETDFPHTRFLSASGAAALLKFVASHGITGGSVYDALVGAAALEHALPLMTLDRRALGTYRELGVQVETLD